MTSKSAASAPERPSAQATFVGSFVDPLAPLEGGLPELAFLGRSNVGKSSLLNALTGSKGLAKVSATPGKTQAMNVFRVEGRKSQVAASVQEQAAARPATFDLRPYYLLDLPGYGYAKTSKTERSRFASLIQGILTARPSLSGVVWLLDIRHDPSNEDRSMAELLGTRGIPVLAVLTKADKLGKATVPSQARGIARALGLAPDQVEVTSSKNGEGIGPLRDSIAALLGGQEAQA